MTRKDYVLIANALANVMLPNDDAVYAWRDTVTAIATALAGDNPRFDRARFIAATGYNGRYCLPREART